MGIKLDIRWTQPDSLEDPEAGAWGAACLSIDGDPVWGKFDEPIEWSWADLLEHLAWYWPWLLWEQGNPLDLQSLDPRKIRDKAEERWESMPLAQVEAEDEILYGWERRHWLNQSLGALYLPGVFVVREGLRIWVGTDARVNLEPLSAVITDLERIGDDIAAQVARSTSLTAQSLVQRWKDRLAISDIQRASTALKNLIEKGP